MVDQRVIDTIIAEALGEGDEGMTAVAYTILNRSNNRDQTPLEVVKAPSQYSGYDNPGSSVQRAMQDPAVRARVEAIWEDVQTGAVPDPTQGGEYFHTTDISPGWSDGVNTNGTTQVGNHTFYLGEATPAAVSPEVPARRPDTATAAIDEALGIAAPGSDPLGYAATTADTVAKPTAAQLQALRDPMAAASPNLDQQLLSRYAENYVPTKDRVASAVAKPTAAQLQAMRDPMLTKEYTIRDYDVDSTDAVRVAQGMFGDQLQFAPKFNWQGGEQSTNIEDRRGETYTGAPQPKREDYFGDPARPTLEEAQAFDAAMLEWGRAPEGAFDNWSANAPPPRTLTGGPGVPGALPAAEDDPAAIVEAALGTTPTTPDAARVAVDNITSQKPTDWGRLYESLGINPPPEATSAPKTAGLTFDKSPTDLDTFYQGLGLKPPSDAAIVEEAGYNATGLPSQLAVGTPFPGSSFKVDTPLTPEPVETIVADTPDDEALRVLEEEWSPSTSGRVLTGDEPLAPIAPADALDKERLTADTGLTSPPPLPKTTTWADLFKMREPAQVAPIPATRSAQVAPIPATRAPQIPPMPRPWDQGEVARLKALARAPVPTSSNSALPRGHGTTAPNPFFKNPLEITINGGAPEIPPMPMPRPASRMPGLLQSFNQPKPVVAAPVPAVKSNGPDSILGRIQARRAAKAAAQAQGTSSSSSSGTSVWGDSSYDSPEAQALLAWASNS